MSILGAGLGAIRKLLPESRTHLQAGMAAPELGVPATDGGIVTTASLQGQTWLLYFYPKDQTPGCTRQACDIRDNWGRIQAAGVKVYGISLDGLDDHKKFTERHQLPFPLLADTMGSVAERWGVLGGLGPLRMARRVSFLVDPEGRILQVFDPAATNGHTDEVLAALPRGGR